MTGTTTEEVKLLARIRKIHNNGRNTKPPLPGKVVNRRTITRPNL